MKKENAKVKKVSAKHVMVRATDLQPAGTGEIVLYQPSSNISMEVRLDSKLETVWLTQQQIADLFGTKRPAITKHLSNIYQSGELDKDSTCSILEHLGNDSKQRYETAYYNLDAILSVGYRVNSINATAFRRWATNILKSYMLKGYAVHQQLLQMEERIDSKLLQQHDEMQLIKCRQDSQQQQLDFFIRTNTPPAEMVFFEGDFYRARVALENLVKMALRRAIIIDRYVDALTLDILGVRATGVEAVIYTSGVGQGMQRLMNEHDRLFPGTHIDIKRWRKESHDRWLIVDDRLYHCGHSLNANGGHKISAITLMGISPETILKEVVSLPASTK